MNRYMIGLLFVEVHQVLKMSFLFPVVALTEWESGSLHPSGPVVLVRDSI